MYLKPCADNSYTTVCLLKMVTFEEKTQTFEGFSQLFVFLGDKK